MTGNLSAGLYYIHENTDDTSRCLTASKEGVTLKPKGEKGQLWQVRVVYEIYAADAVGSEKCTNKLAIKRIRNSKDGKILYDLVGLQEKIADPEETSFVINAADSDGYLITGADKYSYSAININSSNPADSSPSAERIEAIGTSKPPKAWNFKSAF
ncbi:hypothetical protein D9756_011081 [Leucocoprinus leucothites]|uniref:Uncharacterized protein n=1 Tax=Leucocoprinus leucothites TaxID=201217 RepID=A0A8H5CNA2_9AGAR|nr:hypothetical protein D9756_011081 [Leucoagaricus leucothites]